MANRRFLLFIGAYPPEGGWNEFVADFESLIDALNMVDCISCQWWHIVDTNTNTVVKSKHEAA